MKRPRVQLEYASVRRMRCRWLRWLTLFVTIAVGIAVTPLVYRRIGCLIDQYSYVWWQRAARVYEPSDGLLAYDDDRHNALKLLQKPGYRSAHIGHLRSTDPSWRAVGYLPEPLRNPRHGWVSNLYVHERQSADGKRWLSMIGLQLHPHPGGRRLQVYSFDRPIVGILPDPKFTLQMGCGGSSLNIVLSEPDHLRIFSGRSDVADSSRVTIQYELNGTRGTIEGIATQYGTVLRVLSGPLAPSGRASQL